MLLTFNIFTICHLFSIIHKKKSRTKPKFYLSISIKLHPLCHLLHLYVFLVLDDPVIVVGLFLDEEVEAEGGGDADADADEHDIPDIEVCYVSDMEDYDTEDFD